MKKKKKKSFLRKTLVRLFAVALLLGIAYAIATRQRPGPSVPVENPEDRVIVKDEEQISGLGTLMAGFIAQKAADPEAARILDGINLILAIEPTVQPETAITMTFSDGYVVLEPGVVPDPDVVIVCDYDVLMQIASMGWGMDAVKYMQSPEGRELGRKMLTGELKMKGALLHPSGMMGFARFMGTA